MTSSTLAAEATPTRTRGTAEGREFTMLVTALMAMTALGIDLMLPAFPDMRAEFGMASDSTQVAWVITAYFLGMAIGPWFYGPVSDRHGRRTPLFAGLVLYCVGASVAALAPVWPLLLIARFFWGIGASGPRSLAVTMIRDRHEGDAMARLMSMIMAVFMIVPVVAPSLGAGLIAILPWRAVFWAPAGFSLVMMLWARRLPETLDPSLRRPFTFTAVATAGKEVVTHRRAMAMTIAMVFTYSTMTAYLGSSELILGDVYGYEKWFPLFFAAVAVLFMGNSLLNARLVQHWGLVLLIRRMSLVGLTMSGVFFVVSLLHDGRPNFWVFAVALAFAMPIAQGLGPTCNSAAMTPLPHVAGTASAIIATATTAGGAIAGGLASSAFDGTVRPFAAWMLVFMAVATFFVWWGTAKGTGQH